MKFSFALFLLSGLLVPTSLYSSMSGGAYEIYADSLGFVSSDSATGGLYTLYGSGGTYAAVSSTGGVYELRGGFQSQEKGILSVDIDDSTVSLGALTVGSVVTSSVVVSVSTDSETGYSLFISDDGDLRSGAETIDDVLDGSVTSGSEEYGIVTTGDDVLGGLALPIAESLTQIASSSGTVTRRQTTVEFQVAIDGSTQDGAYEHTVLFSVIANP